MASSGGQHTGDTLSADIPGFLARLGARFGQGGAAITYALADAPGEAVKEIPLVGLNATAKAALEAALYALRRLEHAGVLRCLATFRYDDCLYIHMERYSQSLDAFTRACRRRCEHVPQDVLVGVARQVAAALAYLHDPDKKDAVGAPLGVVVHGAITPGNILLSKDARRVVLSDAGLHREGALGRVTGYTAPEVLRGQPPTPVADLWSLGAVLYELLAERRLVGPGDGDDDDAPGWQPDLTLVQDSPLVNVLTRLLSADPAKRGSAQALVEMLDPDKPSLDKRRLYCEEELQAELNKVKGIYEGKELGYKNKISSLQAELKRNSEAHDIVLKNLNERLRNSAGQRTSIQQEPNMHLKAENDKLKEELAQSKLENTNLKQQQQTSAKNTEKMVKTLSNFVKPGHTEIIAFFISTGVTELMDAAFSNNILAISNLISFKKSIGEQDSSGMTALMYAAGMGHIEAVKLLIAHEKGIRNNNGKTAMLIAAESNQGTVVATLAQHEKGLRIKNGQTALMHAAVTGSAEAVRLLLSYEKRLTDDQGMTALMLAAQHGQIGPVKVLAPHEHSMTTSSGLTALMCAAQSGHIEVAYTLLRYEKGLRTNDGRTAMFIAAESGHDDVVSALIPYEGGLADGSGQTALMLATKLECTEAVKVLFEYEKKIIKWTSLMYATALGNVELMKKHLTECRQKDIQGRTALMYAAQKGDVEATRLLLLHEMKERDMSGYTALMYAAREGRVESITFLMEHEAKMQSNTGWTALMLAAKNGHVVATQALLDNEKAMTNGVGCTALMYAAKQGHTKIVNALHTHEEAAQDKNGQTALMFAARYGHIEAMKLLLPAEKCKMDRHGQTALAIAACNTQLSAVKLLAPYEVESSRWTPLIHAAFIGDLCLVQKHLLYHKRGQDISGRTALMYAAQSGHVEIVKLLAGHEAKLTDHNESTALMLAAESGNAQMVSILVEAENGMKNKAGKTALFMANYWNHSSIANILSNYPAESM